MIKKGKLGKIWAIVCSILACVLVFSLTACDGGQDKDVALTLDKTTAEVVVDETATLSVTSSTTETIEWSVDKPDVATVKGSGTGNKLCTVTGVKAGTAKVTAKAGEKTATCTVTVKEKQVVTPETVTIKLGDTAVTEAHNMEVGETATFTATASKGSAITWESSKTDVATVDKGTVTAKAAGETVIKAKVSDTVFATVTVKVTAAVPETVTIKLGEAEVGSEAQVLHMGDTATFTATASKGSAITWESSNTEVATVANGTVTAVAAGEAVITAKVSDTVSATVTVKVIAPTDIAFGGEDSFNNGWRYWSGDSADVAVASCVRYAETNEIQIKYTMTVGQPYSVQLFYKDKLAGKNHGVSLTVVSPVEANITINGAKQELKAGENKVTIENYAGSTIVVCFGAWGPDQPVFGTDLEFVFKDIVITSNADAELVVPEFSYAADTKVITITDATNAAENVEKYELGLFANDTDAVPAAIVTVVSGEQVDLSKVDTGEYTARIRAFNSSAAIVNSDWSEATVAISVSNENTNIASGEAVNAVGNPGTWIYWVDGGWCGTTGECTEHYLDSNGAIHVNYSVNHETDYVWEYTAVPGTKGNWFALQLFYKDATLTEGTSYTLTLDITSPVAGKITINDQEVEIVEGANTNISITFTAGAGASISIQLGAKSANKDGAYVLVEGSVVIGNINITPAA